MAGGPRAITCCEFAALIAGFIFYPFLFHAQQSTILKLVRDLHERAFPFTPRLLLFLYEGPPVVYYLVSSYVMDTARRGLTP